MCFQTGPPSFKAVEGAFTAVDLPSRRKATGIFYSLYSLLACDAENLDDSF